MLKCCYNAGCPHPFCSTGNSLALQWFSGGPTVTYILLPIPDSKQPWSYTDCEKCERKCHGHFLDSTKILQLPSMPKPPSVL